MSIRKIYDLTQPLSVQTPAWPTYYPLQVVYFKRLVPNGANGQLITTSNHVGTHLDGELHFCTEGRDIASLSLEFLCGEGVIVDISDIAEDYGIYTSKDIEKRVEVKENDILLINTGYHRYAWYEKEADEIRYFVKHPGPTREFAEWCIKKKIRWLGVDCGSADHPMNTKIREWMPQYAKEAESFIKQKYGKSLDEVFPQIDYQIMHMLLFPKGIIHVENLGGEIDLFKNKRVYIGCFPWRFVGGESSICRVAVFEV